MNEKELLFSVTKKDFDITWFSGKGAGGQHRNKHKNCCRIVHPDSGAIATGQSNKNQKANLKEAFENITKTDKFNTWLKIEVSRKTGELAEIEKSINKKVEDALKEENLKIEYF